MPDSVSRHLLRLTGAFWCAVTAYPKRPGITDVYALQDSRNDTPDAILVIETSVKNSLLVLICMKPFLVAGRKQKDLVNSVLLTK